MSEKKTFSRRRFLGDAARAAGALATFSIVPRHVLGGSGFTPPSEELTRAIIGLGWMGMGHLDYPGARLLALCDVDRNHLNEGLQKAGPGVAGYHDFREVLARPDIDIIHIVTPPHWHGLMSIAAAEAGKDIWCEKPMTRTVAEGRRVLETVQRHGRMFRLNTWFRFTDEFYNFGTTVKPIKKLVRSGLLGWPLRFNVCFGTGIDWRFAWFGLTHYEPQPVPPDFDYEMWLGPAPYKPFHPHRTHKSFRGYWDYDGGDLCDMGQHYLDPVQYMLEKDDTGPVRIEMDAPQQHPDAVGRWRKVRIVYEDGCEIILDGENNDPKTPYIEGPNGKLFRGFESDIPNLREKLAAFPEPEPQLTDFSEAVRTRRKFALNESNGHRSCTLVNIAKIAFRLRRNLDWDPVAERFKGDPAANRLLNEPMRAPWHL